jgi:hypothetical protein
MSTHAFTPAWWMAGVFVAHEAPAADYYVASPTSTPAGSDAHAGTLQLDGAVYPGRRDRGAQLEGERLLTTTDSTRATWARRTPAKSTFRMVPQGLSWSTTSQRGGEPDATIPGSMDSSNSAPSGSSGGSTAGPSGSGGSAKAEPDAASAVDASAPRSDATGCVCRAEGPVHESCPWLLAGALLGGRRRGGVRRER